MLPGASGRHAGGRAARAARQPQRSTAGPSTARCLRLLPRAAGAAAAAAELPPQGSTLQIRMVPSSEPWGRGERDCKARPGESSAPSQLPGLINQTNNASTAARGRAAQISAPPPPPAPARAAAHRGVLLALRPEADRVHRPVVAAVALDLRAVLIRVQPHPHVGAARGEAPLGGAVARGLHGVGHLVQLHLRQRADVPEADVAAVGRRQVAAVKGDLGRGAGGQQRGGRRLQLLVCTLQLL